MKKHILLVLKTLINNNACVEASRTRQIKYNIIAVIFAIIGVFLAVLPTGVNSFKVNGSDWMNLSYVNNCDTGLYNFTKAAKEKNVIFTVNDKTLQIVGWDKIVDTTKKDTENFTDLKPYIFRHKLGDTENARVFEVWNLTDKTDADFTTWAGKIINNINPAITSKEEKDTWMEFTLKDDKSINAKVTRTASAIFFGKNMFYVYMATSTSASRYGDYHRAPTGTNLITKYYDESTDPLKTFEKWKVFFNDSYIDIRWNNSWRSIGIMLGVDFGVLLFMGLMVFILTRGKNNPFRIYSFWDSQKIAYYASFTPSVLALIFGFLMSQMAMMFYVLALGIRVMWLSMRTLRPEGAMQK